MINIANLERIAREGETNLFPNVVREYTQHLFLSELYRLPGAERLLFKGGTALRIVYECPRFSEDLDFSLFGIPANEVVGFTEDLFLATVVEIERMGIHVTIDESVNTRHGEGYLGIATIHVPGFEPVRIEINVSTRDNRDMRGEVEAITSQFLPTYTLYHLPQNELVEEKIFSALLTRKKPRDFYDLYFMLRRGMLTAEQKRHLATVAMDIIAEAKKIGFRDELGAFLPVGQQAIIRNFAETLEREMKGQLSLMR